MAQQKQQKLEKPAPTDPGKIQRKNISSSVNSQAEQQKAVQRQRSTGKGSVDSSVDTDVAVESKRPTRRGDSEPNRAPKQSAHERIREARKGIGADVPSPHRPKVQGYLDRLHGMREAQRKELFRPAKSSAPPIVSRSDDDDESPPDTGTPDPGNVHPGNGRGGGGGIAPGRGPGRTIRHFKQK